MAALSTVLVVFFLNTFSIGVSALVESFVDAPEVEKITKILQDFESKFSAIEKKMVKMEQKYAYKETILRRRVDSLEKQNKLLQDNFLNWCKNGDRLVSRSSEVHMDSAAQGQTIQESQQETERMPVRRLRENTIQKQRHQARHPKDLRGNKSERILKQDIRIDKYSKKTPVQQEPLERSIPMVTKTPSLIPRQTAKQNRVAFYATVTPHDIHYLGANQTIVFDNVRTNIGNSYHRGLGVFIAPVTGTYVFAATLSGWRGVPWVDGLPDNYFYAHIDVGGKTVASFVFFPRWRGQVSQTVIVQLHEGDEVSVKNDLLQDEILGEAFTSFAGFLLYEGDQAMPINVIGK